MTPRMDLLLQGPRGRRLCLELAMELDPEVMTAAFGLGYELDSGRGTSRVLLTASCLPVSIATPASASVTRGARGQARFPELRRPRQ